METEEERVREMSFQYDTQEEVAQQLVPLLVDENAQKVMNRTNFFLSVFLSVSFLSPFNLLTLRFSSTGSFGV